MRQHRHPCALAALVLALAVPLTGFVPASAQDTAAVIDVEPLPGQVVATPATLRAIVATSGEPTDVAVRVDGDEVAATTTQAPVGVEVSAPLADLAPGARTLSVSVTVDGEVETRSWSVTATDHAVDRVAGATRFETAVEISHRTFPRAGSAPTAVLARADGFADALAGAPLAAHLGGPLLLTGTDTLHDATAAELDRVLAAGSPVHVLGGTAAIGPDVEAALVAAGHEVIRHAGADRHATAAGIAATLPPADTVFVASGTRFPDALAASVVAARNGWPILLTGRDSLPAATRRALEAGSVTRVIVVGGPVAVDDTVVDRLERIVDDVDRVAGDDRFATAVELADTFSSGSDRVALASGRAYPDALAAAPRAAALGAPLLLVGPTRLPAATDGWLRSARPSRLVLQGGPDAVTPDVEAAALHAVVDGPEAPRLVAVDPAPGTTSGTLAPIVVSFDRRLDPDRLVAAVTLAGQELPTTVRLDDSGTRAVVDPLTPGDRPFDQPQPVRVVLRVADVDGAVAHHAHTFLVQDHPVFATVGPIELVEPSTAVEIIGYHQSNHEGARDMAPQGATPWVLMDSRGRGTGRYTAADIVADPDVEITAPVTGTVVRGGTYGLYCGRYVDNYLVIEPDARPGYEVKLLHFEGLTVSAGDHVVAGETVVGAGPRQLPFTSQVDTYSSSGHGPHVHVEVIDTSIPNVSNPGSGC